MFVSFRPAIPSFPSRSEKQICRSSFLLSKFSPSPVSSTSVHSVFIKGYVKRLRLCLMVHQPVLGRVDIINCGNELAALSLLHFGRVSTRIH